MSMPECEVHSGRHLPPSAAPHTHHSASVISPARGSSHALKSHLFLAHNALGVSLQRERLRPLTTTPSR